MAKRKTPLGECPNAALYGIAHSNRNFKDPFYWGKNQFNSSFPIALCCYMRDCGKNALGIQMGKDLSTSIKELSFNKVFGTTLPNDKIYFRFESMFEPFKPLVEDSLEKIDVVVVNAETKEEIRPLEIKLTTLPDDGTSSFPESKYGSEIVVRSPTMRYVALSMIASNKDKLKQIKAIFNKACKKVDNWENIAEMKSRQADIFEALKKFLSDFCHTQRPLLIQPIWKTIGKKPQLADNCLDVFVWTDFALTRLILDSLDTMDEYAISVSQREALRLARFLYVSSCDTNVYDGPIYNGMTYDIKDWEEQDYILGGAGHEVFAAMRNARVPVVKRNELSKIVLWHPPFEKPLKRDLYDFMLKAAS